MKLRETQAAFGFPQVTWLLEHGGTKRICITLNMLDRSVPVSPPMASVLVGRGLAMPLLPTSTSGWVNLELSTRSRRSEEAERSGIVSLGFTQLPSSLLRWLPSSAFRKLSILEVVESATDHKQLMPEVSARQSRKESLRKSLAQEGQDFLLGLGVTWGVVQGLSGSAESFGAKRKLCYLPVLSSSVYKLAKSSQLFQYRLLFFPALVNSSSLNDYHPFRNRLVVTPIERLPSTPARAIY